VSGIEREVRSVSLVHYARPFAITSAELNAGHKLADAAEKAAQAMAEKIITLVLAQATEANFGTSIVTTMSGNSNMTAAMLKTGWGSIPGGKKYAIVEDSAYANFLPSDLNQFDPRNGLSVYGFDGMKNVGSSVAPSKFTALFCNPAALCVATAIPDIAPEIQSLMYSYEIVTEPNTGISFAVSHWGDVQTREQYASIDLCFGVAVGDKNAGAVLYSQT
jgi:phage tail protein X